MTRTRHYGNGPSVVFGREKGKKYIITYIPGKKEMKGKGYSGVEFYVNLQDATARIKPARNIEDKLK